MRGTYLECACRQNLFHVAIASHVHLLRLARCRCGYEPFRRMLNESVVIIALVFLPSGKMRISR
jgi:hypothetical protein